MEGKVRIGTISRLHGYKGELSLKIEAEYLDLLTSVGYVYLQIHQRPVPYFIRSVRFTPKGFALVFFEDVSDQATAESLRGAEVWLDEGQVPATLIDNDPSSELAGFTVVDAQFGTIGVVDRIIASTSQDLIVIETEKGDVLIPMIDGLVDRIDAQARIIHTQVPDGLIELNMD